MAVSLHEFSIIRRKNGVTMPASSIPDTQAERACRDVATYLNSLQALPVAVAVGADGGGTTIHPAAVPQPTVAGLAAALQAHWPGAYANTTDEYHWIIDPITGVRVQVCIVDEIVLTTETPAVGSNKPVDPTLVIGFRMLMS